jgi:hypothetical protein
MKTLPPSATASLDRRRDSYTPSMEPFGYGIPLLSASPDRWYTLVSRLPPHQARPAYRTTYAQTQRSTCPCSTLPTLTPRNRIMVTRLHFIVERAGPDHSTRSCDATLSHRIHPSIAHASPRPNARGPHAPYSSTLARLLLSASTFCRGGLAAAQSTPLAASSDRISSARSKAPLRLA